MAKNEEQLELPFEQVPFRIHPRVFAALGADLVTSDVVAVIELVKNSYDAFAENCWVRFSKDAKGALYLEIQDDGQGMDRDTIEDVWAVVATPNKLLNPKARSGRKTRRVVGEKGLGRLSVARLGTHLEMITQSPDDTCWEVRVDWTILSKEEELDDCFVSVREFSDDEVPFDGSGTRLRVFGLGTDWDETNIADLEDNLARLMSPFATVGDFAVMLQAPGDDESESLRVESPEFLSKPKYVISGYVDKNGNVTAQYNFKPIGAGKARQKKSHCHGNKSANLFRQTNSGSNSIRRNSTAGSLSLKSERGMLRQTIQKKLLRNSSLGKALFVKRFARTRGFLFIAMRFLSYPNPTTRVTGLV